MPLHPLTPPFPPAASQVYLGAFDSEAQAARAHDVMALCCNPVGCTLNFSRQDYTSVMPFLAQLPQVGPSWLGTVGPGPGGGSITYMCASWAPRVARCNWLAGRAPP